MTQEMCDNIFLAVDIYIILYLILFLIGIKLKKMCDRIISEETFLIIYCPDKYKPERICDKAVDDHLAALKLILDWFATCKTIKELDTALCADENILYFNEGSVNAICCCDKIGILNIDISNINLDNNFDQFDSILLFLLEFWLGVLNLKNAKHFG